MTATTTTDYERDENTIKSSSVIVAVIVNPVFPHNTKFLVEIPG